MSITERKPKEETEAKPLTSNGSDATRSPTETKVTPEKKTPPRRLFFVEAGKLVPSTLLPPREPDPGLTASVERHGLVQPIIARPSTTADGVYEIIDGHKRKDALKDGQKVLVDVRYGLEDAEVFRISEATFHRQPRSTLERACFYANWVMRIKTTAGEWGAQTKVAQDATIKQAELSHYLAIAGLFDKLREMNTTKKIFNALKSQSVNKLYRLSRVDQEALPVIAAKMAETPTLTPKQVKRLIETETSTKALIARANAANASLVLEDPNIKLTRLRDACNEIQTLFDKTQRRLTVLVAALSEHPQGFVSRDADKGLVRLQKALKRLEKQIASVAKLAEAKGTG